MTQQLAHVTVEVVGQPFLAIWTPEDGAVRAAGFRQPPAPAETEGVGTGGGGGAGAGVGAGEGGGPGAGAAAGVGDASSEAVASGDESPEADPLWARLVASDPALAARGLAAEPTTSGPVPSALRAYAAGDTAALDGLQVAQRETPFRGKVWRALRGVPAGRAVTYSELAARAGRPAAVRAAASGCATNLIALIVPCHRIVRADGGLGGYLFGTAVKQGLLAHEGAGH